MGIRQVQRVVIGQETSDGAGVSLRRTLDTPRVRVIAGESGGVPGPVRGIVTDPLYLDVKVPAGRRFEHPVPEGHNGVLYVFEGSGEIGGGDGLAGRRLEAGRLAVLGEGD